MNNLFFAFLCTLVFSNFCFSQNNSAISSDNESLSNPKLVVGIVVDQMRYDYLTRFYDRYGEGGFKRLLNEGFEFKNNHFNYIPTYTGPGHASVYTGTYPAIHGIIANDWYDKEIKQSVYCAQDDDVNPVGTTHNAGKMSPHRMKTTSITDQLRLHTQQKSRVIGISIKDRGAILPAGHSGTAYWFHGKKEGNWISSSFYMKSLPAWVQHFNTSSIAESYLNDTWNTLYPLETYTESGPDLSPYEDKFKGVENSVFPYDLKSLALDNGNFDIIKETPFGNNITTDFAMAAIDGEQLGKNNITDFLAISYSSPDYIGHTFGPNAVEVQDNYLRLDLEIERLLKFLDMEVGKNNYLIFLTADHGAVHNPNYLQSQNIPAGFFNRSDLETQLKEFSVYTFSVDLIEKIQSNQVFLNKEALKTKNLKSEDVQQTLADFILTYPQIDKVFTRKNLEGNTYNRDTGYLVQNGFNQKRSGDLVFVLDPAVISTWYENGGTTHGSGFTYDTHVPLIFFGNGIKKGHTYQKSEITDITPTLSALLGIARPNGSTGRVLTELFE
ncbi:alkaline phosphatase PafA [Planktosalinus lacus]|uniref:Alkaline phosphatase family protein n=1 Tax=Planktosalinus lacus TaxID=1526573 RepID=A0A8J2V8X3_9FLAO|nr:alkaline phosphatase PafA [Planktosalinus lacus]GGD87076.1 alkaline phosphatase family protein [Planktosalinus lacus]